MEDIFHTTNNGQGSTTDRGGEGKDDFITSLWD